MQQSQLPGRGGSGSRHANEATAEELLTKPRRGPRAFVPVHSHLQRSGWLLHGWGWLQERGGQGVSPAPHPGGGRSPQPRAEAPGFWPLGGYFGGKRRFWGLRSAFCQGKDAAGGKEPAMAARSSRAMPYSVLSRL